jgi:uncharacterized membrane protein (DUF4010 family)
MQPVIPDGPVTSVAIGAWSPIPFIVTSIVVVPAVAILSYLAVRIIRKRRLAKQAQQSQIRVLWGGP